MGAGWRCEAGERRCGVVCVWTALTTPPVASAAVAYCLPSPGVWGSAAPGLHPTGLHQPANVSVPQMQLSIRPTLPRPPAYCRPLVSVVAAPRQRQLPLAVSMQQPWTLRTPCGGGRLAAVRWRCKFLGGPPVRPPLPSGHLRPAWCSINSPTVRVPMYPGTGTRPLCPSSQPARRCRHPGSST